MSPSGIANRQCARPRPKSLGTVDDVLGKHLRRGGSRQRYARARELCAFEEASLEAGWLN